MANPIHPLDGQNLAVRHVTRLAGVRVVLAEHPDGGTLSLPESVLDQTPRPNPGPGCLLDVSRLVMLAGRVGQLKARG